MLIPRLLLIVSLVTSAIKLASTFDSENILDILWYVKLTDGEFVGYTILGEEGALVFKVSGEKNVLLRLIPVSNLIAIDFGEDEVVTQGKSKTNHDSVNYIS